MYEDWLARWRDGRTSFHEGRPNALLARHLARLAGCRRVLVPLCGKAEDLAYLAAHDHAVGVELAEQAVREFELLEERPYGGGKCMQSGVSATERGFALRFDERR